MGVIAVIEHTILQFKHIIIQQLLKGISQEN